MTNQWRHNGRDSVSNYQPHDCLLNRLFRRRSKKTSKLLVIGFCAANSSGTVEFPAQRASNAENDVIMIWRSGTVDVIESTWIKEGWKCDSLSNSHRATNPHLYRPIDAYISHHTESSLVQIIAYALFAVILKTRRFWKNISRSCRLKFSQIQNRWLLSIYTWCICAGISKSIFWNEKV